MSITTNAELTTAIQNWLEGRSDTTLTNRVAEFIALAEDMIAVDLRIRVRAMETQGTLVWKLDIDGGTVAGTANAITLSGQTGTPTYADSFTFTAGSTSTSTVTVNGYALKKRYGGIKEGLAAGDVLSGATYRIYFDGTDFLISPQAGSLVPTDYLEFRSVRRDASDYFGINFRSPADFWDRDSNLTTGSARSFTIEGDWAIVSPKPDSTARIVINYYRRFTRFSGASDTNWLLANASGIYLYAALIQATPFIGEDDQTLKWAAMYDDLAEKLQAANSRAQFPSGMLAMRSRSPTP